MPRAPNMLPLLSSRQRRSHWHGPPLRSRRMSDQGAARIGSTGDAVNGSGGISHLPRGSARHGQRAAVVAGDQTLSYTASGRARRRDPPPGPERRARAHWRPPMIWSFSGSAIWQHRRRPSGGLAGGQTGRHGLAGGCLRSGRHHPPPDRANPCLEERMPVSGTSSTRASPCC